VIQTATAFSSAPSSQDAAQDIAYQLRTQLSEADALIVFCSSKHNFEQLLTTLRREFPAQHLVGCSSAGEFSGTYQSEGSVSAFALRSDEMAFASGVGLGLSDHPAEAARGILASFRSEQQNNYRYQYALVLNDALAGYAEELIQELTLQSGGRLQLFGGGAGDDAAFKKTHVFWGTEAHTNAAVALQILSNKPLGIGVRHGWGPATAPYRVTESSGAVVQSLNATPVAEVMVEYAERSQQKLDLAEPLPFLLHNILGIKTDVGYKLRVPLGFAEGGSLACAAEIPEGAAVSIMSADGTSSAHAAAEAAKDAVAQLEGHKPKAALFFDCVATRLRVGKGFGHELKAVEDAIGAVPLVGCNTYGQISRVDGQANGFHNCTAVVCVFPE
jgi:hypothetical protein